MTKREYFVKLPSGNIIKTPHPELFSDVELMHVKQGAAEYRKQVAKHHEQLKAELLQWVKPGDTVYTILCSVSRSGMSRTISSFVIVDGLPRKIDYHVSSLLGWKQDDEGVKVGGCGMDMGFHLVYTLGCRLWPEGTEVPHGTRNGEPDSDGGYALKRVWF